MSVMQTKEGLHVMIVSISGNVTLTLSVNECPGVNICDSIAAWTSQGMYTEPTEGVKRLARIL